ncbi:MAG: hypothetical protein HRT89_20935 [Lentisphaeria bacterium]|nr:hypothetical protein [Lentisphaeria bacterium]NQZ70526.1 hypothetical protein [Lentisphaeria bacterium]
MGEYINKLLNLARKRWYITLFIALICASPFLLVMWRVHKIKVAIAQLKKQKNPQQYTDPAEIDNKTPKANEFKNKHYKVSTDVTIPKTAEKINASFVFMNGEYIETPYQIYFNKGWLMLNNRYLVELSTWPIWLTGEDKPPADVFINAKSFDDLTISKHRTWHYTKVAWIYRHFKGQERKTEIINFFESLSFVESADFDSGMSEVHVKLTNGEKKIIEYPYLNKQTGITREYLKKHIVYREETMIKSLKKNHTYLYFSNGLSLSFGNIKDIKEMRQVLKSKKSPEEKLAILRRMKIVPDIEDRFVISLVENYKDSKQLDKRLDDLVNAN